MPKEDIQKQGNANHRQIDPADHRHVTYSLKTAPRMGPVMHPAAIGRDVNLIYAALSCNVVMVTDGKCDQKMPISTIKINPPLDGPHFWSAVYHPVSSIILFPKNIYISPETLSLETR